MFIKEITSWHPLMFYRNNGMISRCPQTERTGKIINGLVFEWERETYCKYGMDYNFDKDFFHNFQELCVNVESPALTTYAWTSENCDYADTIHNTKNAYLVFNSVWDNENLFYSLGIKDKCTNVFNSVMIWDGSQNIYTCSWVIKSYKIFFSRFVVNSDNIWFSSNMMGCSECIACEWLTNQKYCIENTPLEKDIYFQRKEEWMKKKDLFQHIYEGIPPNGANFGSKDVKWNFIIDSQRVQDGHFVYQVNEWQNLIITGSSKWDERMYDVCVWGSGVSNDFYGVCGWGTAQKIYIWQSIGMSSNIYYSRHIDGCSYCLGCTGLKNKSFCILNKQYTKEEWFELADRIFAQMESDEILWSFFPWWMSPFYFNDTVAYLIDDSFVKEEITKEGYLRRDEEIKVDIPVGAEIVQSRDLASYQGYNQEGQREINSEILKKVIVDKKWNSYRIVKMEYDFLLKHGLPLPEIHWLERIKLWFKFK